CLISSSSSIPALPHILGRFVTSASQYLVQLERRLSPQFARKFSLFRSGPQQTAASTVEFGLWDARVCKFQLIEPNWIVQHPRPSYQASCKWLDFFNHSSTSVPFSHVLNVFDWLL
ncbi:hypothetical protein D915_006666, partial [Fasciola hepatica]